MNGKNIDGSLAWDVARAAGCFARLEGEMSDLTWRICLHGGSPPAVHLARKHCRDLLETLRRIDDTLRAQEDAERAARKVVKLDEQRKNADA